METPTPSLREQGLQALRESNLDGAIDLLARAVMADAQDAEAQAFLGVAYSQKGLHAQAVRALQTAVSLQPQEARYRFNLGVAMESGGDAAGAAEAYRETLRLNPQHPQARTRLQGIGAEAGTAATRAAPAGVGTAAPVADESPGSTWFGNQPPPAAPSMADAPAGATPWLAGQQAAAAAAGPPGTVQCPNCKQWSKPGLSCEWCSGALKPAAAAPAAPWLQPSNASRESVADYSYSAGPSMGAGEAFGRRFAAFFIDGIVTNVLSFVVTFALGLSIGTAAGVSGRPDATGSMLAMSQLSGALAGMVIGFSYYIGMTCWRGQTLGKMALGIRVSGPEGGNPVFWRATLRETIGRLLSSIFALGYLWMLWDADQQTWHDKIAGTTVDRA
jgi:uncharacterized RDD family membrane protein YckC